MSHATADDRPGGGGGYAELLRTHGAFRLLWFAQIASVFGDWFNIIASSSLLAQLTGAGAALGGLFAVRMLGAFVVSPLAGVLADRFNRKRILIVTGLLRAVVVLGFLLVRTSGHFVAAVRADGGPGGHQRGVQPGAGRDPARGRDPPHAGRGQRAHLVDVVDADGNRRRHGRTVRRVVRHPGGVVVDAATYGLSAVLLARMPYVRATRSAGHGGQPAGVASTARAGVGEYLDGLRYLWREQRMLAVALQKGFLMFFVSGFQVASVAIAGTAIASTAFALGQGDGLALGVLFASSGVGSGVSPLVARRLIGDDRRAMRLTMLAGYVTLVAALVLAAPLASFALVIVGSTLRGIAAGLIWVYSTQLLLETVPEELRGRVIATEHAALTLLGAAGSAGVGAVLEWAAIPTALWIMAALVVAPTLHWAAAGVRNAAKPPTES